MLNEYMHIKQLIFNVREGYGCVFNFESILKLSICYVVKTHTDCKAVADLVHCFVCFEVSD